MRAALTLLLAFLTAPAAAADIVEIRLGRAPSPPPRVEPAKVHSVVGFLSARQAGSRDRSRRDEARVYVTEGTKIEEVALFGPRRLHLVAFDFHDRAIRGLPNDRFEVSVYLLFADAEGHVRESRAEIVTFTRAGAEYRVTSLRTANEILWGEEGVQGAAASRGLAEELGRAEHRLRAWTNEPRRAHAFSVADVYRTDDGGVVVECLRFAARPGARGYEVLDDPLRVTSSGVEFPIESN